MADAPGIAACALRVSRMKPNYPPDVAALMNSVDEALRRLRREMRRAKQLLKVTEEYRRRADTNGLRFGPELIPYHQR